MARFINTFFEERVEQLFQMAELVERIFSSAGLEYRIVGGLAAYLYVEDVEPDAGRLTKDIDVVVRRQDLERIAEAAEPCGLRHRHVGGVNMLVQADQPSARRAIHFVFAGEKVRPEYPEIAPELGPYREIRGLRLIPVEELIRLNLASFRLRDQTDLKDLDEAGAITPDIEAWLSPLLAERLAAVRAHE